MAIHIDIEEAAEPLDDLVDAALGGEDVILFEEGRPKVRLVPVAGAVMPLTDPPD